MQMTQVELMLSEDEQPALEARIDQETTLLKGLELKYGIRRTTGPGDTKYFAVIEAQVPINEIPDGYSRVRGPSLKDSTQDEKRNN